MTKTSVTEQITHRWYTRPVLFVADVNRVGCNNGTTGVRDLDGIRRHRIAGTNFSAVGRRSRCRVSTRSGKRQSLKNHGHHPDSAL